MKTNNNKVTIEFDYSKWQKKLKLDRLKKSIDEFTFYPCSKEINEQVDYIIKRDVKGKYFENDLIKIQYRYRVLNDFYFLLFEIANFDELRYIDLSKAFNNPQYLKNSGKIVSKNFYHLNPHLDNSRKLKSITSSFINKEFFLIDGLIKMKIEKRRIDRIKDKVSLKDGGPVLAIYKNIIRELEMNNSISVRKACRNEYEKQRELNLSNNDFDAFYNRFLSFYKTNSERFSKESQLIQNLKQKKVSSR